VHKAKRRTNDIFSGEPTSMRSVTTLGGWTRLRNADIGGYRCPHCSAISETLYGFDGGDSRCWKCNTASPMDDYRQSRLQRTIATCGGCAKDVPFSSSYQAPLGYLCPDCNSYVALEYGRRRVQPSIVLDVEWNGDARQRAVSINSGVAFIQCRSRKDDVVLHALQVLAKQDAPEFMYGMDGEHKAWLLLVGERRYGGYLMWSEEETHATLRQLFVLRDLRRQGIAAAAVKFWVTTVADRHSLRFGVESPTEAAVRLLQGTGFVSKTPVKEDKAFSVFGL
jgi:hypothetical protein